MRGGDDMNVLITTLAILHGKLAVDMTIAIVLLSVVHAPLKEEQVYKIQIFV